MFWLATLLFLLAYVVILSEKINKTKVALAGAGLMIVLSVVSQQEAFYSEHLGVDYNVIFLLIFMMILVGITSQSGVFEWTAVKLAKLAKGNPMTIMIYFVIFTAVASAFLDNVTTVLLVAPVTLFICDEQELDPTPFLIAEALSSNIGGTATLIGDPPNLLIGSKAQLGFNDFLFNLGPAVVVMMIALLITVRIFFAKKLVSDEAKRERIMKMDESKLIKDRSLVIKSCTVLGLTILGFCLHDLVHLQPATIAMMGAAALLLISKLDPHDILKEVEWPTVFFFIGLFILVGGVVKVGLISELSKFVINVTHPTEDNMFTTSIVMLWFSGVASAIVDNIPYVATMSPLVQDMANTVFHEGAHAAGALPVETLHHDVLSPVWWALALGSCLGGNGTAIGASANVIVLGIAERNGHKISFMKFAAYGLPVMIGTLIISTAYIVLRYYT
ncbi:MAG: ArsB/NhaD family transporter [Acidobacteria bacterium]|nr:ArsB/NhaD family transporter [Acidobacteriota bacterium]MCB9399169.1 ArsB/NhaD family transporter [Acidobacteriota bacterium]